MAGSQECPYKLRRLLMETLEGSFKNAAQVYGYIGGNRRSYVTYEEFTRGIRRLNPNFSKSEMSLLISNISSNGESISLSDLKSFMNHNKDHSKESGPAYSSPSMSSAKEASSTTTRRGQEDASPQGSKGVTTPMSQRKLDFSAYPQHDTKRLSSAVEESPLRSAKYGSPANMNVSRFESMREAQGKAPTLKSSGDRLTSQLIASSNRTVETTPAKSPARPAWASPGRMAIAQSPVSDETLRHLGRRIVGEGPAPSVVRLSPETAAKLNNTGKVPHNLPQSSLSPKMFQIVSPSKQAGGSLQKQYPKVVVQPPHLSDVDDSDAETTPEKGTRGKSPDGPRPRRWSDETERRLVQVSASDVLRAVDKFAISTGAGPSNKAFKVPHFKQALYDLLRITDEGVIDKVFKAFDADSSGEVSKVEFMCGLAVLCHGTTWSKLEFAFRAADADEDGYISKGELVGLLHSMLVTGVRIADILYYGVENLEQRPFVTPVDWPKMQELIDDLFRSTNVLSYDMLESWAKKKGVMDSWVRKIPGSSQIEYKPEANKPPKTGSENTSTSNTEMIPSPSRQVQSELRPTARVSAGNARTPISRTEKRASPSSSGIDDSIPGPLQEELRQLREQISMLVQRQGEEAMNMSFMSDDETHQELRRLREKERVIEGRLESASSSLEEREKQLDASIRRERILQYETERKEQEVDELLGDKKAKELDMRRMTMEKQDMESKIRMLEKDVQKAVELEREYEELKRDHERMRIERDEYKTQALTNERLYGAQAVRVSTVEKEHWETRKKAEFGEKELILLRECLVDLLRNRGFVVSDRSDTGKLINELEQVLDSADIRAASSIEPRLREEYERKIFDLNVEIERLEEANREQVAELMQCREDMEEAVDATYKSKDLTEMVMTLQNHNSLLQDKVKDYEHRLMYGSPRSPEDSMLDNSVIEQISRQAATDDAYRVENAEKVRSRIAKAKFDYEERVAKLLRLQFLLENRESAEQI